MAAKMGSQCARRADAIPSGSVIVAGVVVDEVAAVAGCAGCSMPTKICVLWKGRHS